MKLSMQFWRRNLQSAKPRYMADHHIALTVWKEVLQQMISCIFFGHHRLMYVSLQSLSESYNDMFRKRHITVIEI